MHNENEKSEQKKDTPRNTCWTKTEENKVSKHKWLLLFDSRGSVRVFFPFAVVYQLTAIGLLSLCHTRDYYFDFIVFIAHFFFSLSNLFLLLCATLDAFYWIGCCIYWKLRCHIDCPRSVTLCLGRKYFINYIFVVATFAMVWLRILCLFFFRSSVVRSLFDVSFFRSKEIDWKSLSSTSLPFYVERETKNKY